MHCKYVISVEGNNGCMQWIQFIYKQYIVRQVGKKSFRLETKQWNRLKLSQNCWWLIIYLFTIQIDGVLVSIHLNKDHLVFTVIEYVWICVAHIDAYIDGIVEGDNCKCGHR